VVVLAGEVSDAEHRMRTPYVPLVLPKSVAFVTSDVVLTMLPSEKTLWFAQSLFTIGVVLDVTKLPELLSSTVSVTLADSPAVTEQDALTVVVFQRRMELFVREPLASKVPWLTITVLEFVGALAKPWLSVVMTSQRTWSFESKAGGSSWLLVSDRSDHTPNPSLSSHHRNVFDIVSPTSGSDAFALHVSVLLNNGFVGVMNGLGSGA
jgi:hypothetical protein